MRRSNEGNEPGTLRSRAPRVALLLVIGLAGAVVASGPAGCTSSQNGNGATGPDGGFAFDATTGGGDGATTLPDGATIPTDGAAPADGASPGDGACTGATTGPLALTCADFPGDDPCPNQAILTDATKFAALKTAMTSGVLLHSDIPFSSGDSNIYKEKCGLEGFWDPTKATALIPPATSIPELASLFAPSSDGNAGICAGYTAQGTNTDGFPATGTYRIQFHAAYQGQTYVVRARANVSGSAAGQSFVAAGLDAGSTTGLAGSLVYQVNGATVAEATLWSSLVGAFTSSSTGFPTATLTVMNAAGGPVVWTATLDLLCASEKGVPAAGPGVISVADTISVAGSPGAMTFNGGTKKAYVALTSVSDAGFTEPAGIAVINDTTNAVVGSVTTPNAVVALASNGTTSTVYASEQTMVDVINSGTDAITTTVAVPNNEQAQGLAVDETNNVVYVLGGSHIYALSGATNTFGATPIAFTGMTPPTADFTGGKPALALDSTTGTLYAIGLDSSLNGVIQSFNASAGTPIQSYALMTNQPTAIVASPTGGAVASVVSASNTFGVLLVGQTVTATSFVPASIARCGTTVSVVGSDGTGLAQFLSFTPAAGALGAATTLDATELQENGYVPAGIATAGTSGSGCTFYGGYTYNYNALYSNTTGYTPSPPPYVVKYVND